MPLADSPARPEDLDVVAGVEERFEQGAEVGVGVVAQPVQHVRSVR